MRQMSGSSMTSALFDWMELSLAHDAVEDHGVGRVVFSGHGCTFALVGADHLVHPILDYEQEPPRAVAGRIRYRSCFLAKRFPLSCRWVSTTGGVSLWLADRKPELLSRSDAILAYPQFWSWKFSGRKVSEVSYLGCHSHLWAPLENDFSSLVDGQSWRSKMPRFVRAGQELGSFKVVLSSGDAADVVVHNGVHDSNSALYFYRSIGFTNFTLVSTGTWVIIFNTSCPLEALDEKRDMLANVTVDHQPVATIRFMEWPRI